MHTHVHDFKTQSPQKSLSGLYNSNKNRKTHTFCFLFSSQQKSVTLATCEPLSPESELDFVTMVEDRQEILCKIEVRKAGVTSHP